MRESPPDTGFTARRGNRRDYHRAPAGVDMDVSDRHNWLLSGLVGLLLVANGLARLPRWSAALDLVLAGALVTGGGLASVNAYVGLRDPDSVADDYWTTRKTLVNAVAVLVLSVLLAGVLARTLA